MDNAHPTPPKRRVLVVDDDPLSLTLLDRVLTNAGYSALKASNGVEALRVMQEHGPHMIIVDWMMPEMDGLQFCREMRSQEWAGRAYIIIVTANSDEDHVVEAFEAGADDFISKPVKPREVIARLRAGQRIVDLQTELDKQNREMLRINAQMSVANDKLLTIATTDELTGLLNRREAMNRLSEHWAAAERHGDPLSCIMLDIDHFKSVNDNHGHAVGDLVLKSVSLRVKNSARANDIVCRVGGEEFLILCPRTPLEGAHIGAERIRGLVAANPIDYEGGNLVVTISLGVAERHDAVKSIDALLRAADEALYAAKRGGRNRVVVAESLPVAASL